jgi:hypothetical protein
MTKTELQIALAEATQTNKRTGRAFPGYALQPRLQGDQEERRIRAARLWETGEAKEESANRHQSQDATKDQDPRKDRGEIPGREGGKRRGSGSEKIVLAHADPQDEVSPEK